MEGEEEERKKPTLFNQAMVGRVGLGPGFREENTVIQLILLAFRSILIASDGSWRVAGMGLAGRSPVR